MAFFSEAHHLWPLAPHMLKTVCDSVGPSTFIMQESQLAELPYLANLSAVGSVLVASQPDSRSNPASSFPLAELAPYAARGYRWNPAGQDVLGTAFPFSIVQLDGNASLEAQSGAIWNEDRVSIAQTPPLQHGLH